MTDAHLVYDIDSRPAVEAETNLDRMNAAAKRAEGQAARTSVATDKLAQSIDREADAARKAEQAATKASVALTGQAKGIDQVANAAAHAAQEQLEFAAAAAKARQAALEADVAAGKLVKTINPTNGAVSFVPALAKDAHAATGAVGNLADVAGKAANANDEAGRAANGHAAAVSAVANAALNAAGATQGWVGDLASLVSGFGAFAAVSLIVDQVALAFQEAAKQNAMFRENIDASNRLLSTSITQLDETRDAVLKLADAYKQLQLEATKAQIAKNNEQIQGLSHESRGETIATFIPGGLGVADALERRRKRQVDALQDENARLLGREIQLRLSDTRARDESQKLIDSALPKEKQVRDLKTQEAAIQLRINAGLIDRATGERAIAALVQREKDALAGPKARSAHAAPAAPRDMTDERTAQIDQQLAQAKAAELQSQIGVTHDVMERARLQKDVVAQDLAQQQAKVAQTSAGIADDKGLSDAKKAALIGELDEVKAINERVATAKARAIDDAAADAQARESLDLANAQRDSEAALLQSQLALATTAKARGEIEMRMLRLADERATAEAQAVIYSKTASDTQKAIAEEVKRSLDATRANREEAQKRATAIAGADEIIRELQLIDGLAQRAGQGLAEAFGRAGGALGDLVSSLSGLRVEMAKINAEEISKAITPDEAGLKRSAAQIHTYGDLTAAAKGFFKEGSKGWKALEAAEKVYRAFEFAMAVKSLFFKTAEVATTQAGVAAKVAAVGPTVAADTATAASGTAAGAGKIFAALGPFGFPVVAAMVAVMAALGFSGAGSAAGGKTVVNPKDARRDSMGAGTVLGDPAEKSASIAHSLEIAAENSNKDLEYSNSMLKALRSIDSKIGLLAGRVAQQISVAGSMFDTAGLSLGTKASSGFLGFGGKSTTRTLNDLGITLNAQTLQDIFNNGIDGQTYQEVQNVKTKKKLFGGSKTKTTYETTFGEIEQDIKDAIADVLLTLKTSLVEASKVVGIEGADALLDAFKIEIGTISFEGMKGQEIEDTLNAVFSKVGDQMAGAVLPALVEMQQVGEGLFETFVRVAREYQVVDTALASIGKTFGMVGVESLKARDSLVQLFGSLDDFAEQTAYFAENFLTEAERMAPIQAAIVKEFQRLGVSGVNNVDQFKQLVMGLDLTTDAGQQMYAALLAVAPAFKKVFDYLTPEQAKDTGNAWRGVFEDMQDWIRELNGEIASSVRSTSQAFAALQAAAKAAQGGDVEAADQVRDLGNAYLDALKKTATSQFEYLRGEAAVRNIATSVQATAATYGGATTNTGTTTSVPTTPITATPFSPATSATGATAPSYTYTAPVPANDPAPVAPTKPNWATYLTHYLDVAAEAQKPGVTGLGYTPEAYAQWHYQNIGQYEGRVPYAMGGIADRPMTVGEAGIMGEAGPEGILPLAKVDGRLGVHAIHSGAGDVGDAMNALGGVIQQGHLDAARQQVVGLSTIDASVTAVRDAIGAQEAGASWAQPADVRPAAVGADWTMPRAEPYSPDIRVNDPTLAEAGPASYEPAHNDNSDVLAALNVVATELQNQRTDHRSVAATVAAILGRMDRRFDRWDGEGLPPDRDAEEAA